jgi:hypothetical protein
VPHQTLSDRINGRSRKRSAQAPFQLLSEQQELTLVDWIDHRATTAKPLDRHGVQSIAFELSGTVPGKNWHRRFEKRHPNLRSSKPGNLDPKRAQNFNPTNVARYFDLLKAVFDAHPDLPPQQIWNMDEKGLQLGGGRKRSKKYYHLRDLKKSKFYRIRSDNLELVTIIECVSPSGLSVPPSFVLSTGPTPALLDLETPIGAVATSPNGWTDNELGTEWFKQTFIPFATAHKVNNDPILLLLDGHDSHETDGLRELAYENNIIIIAFPSKCTHKLQPLDVVVFAQTQRSWSNHCDQRIYEGVRMNRYNVVQEYMKVRSASMTPELFASAFSCTGIYPFNPNLFTNVDFGPAQSFSISMHAPKSFPAEAPSSPPLPSDMSDCNNSENGDFEDQSSSDPEDIQMDWDTDPDDLDYEPQSDHMSMSSSLPSGLPPVPAAVPAVPPSAMHPSLVVPALSATINVSSEPSDDISIDLDTLSRPPSGYFTRSQRASSSPLSVSIALHYSRAPIPSSSEEKDSEINRLRMKVELIERELVLARASNNASDAHCTIMQRAASDARTEIEQHKRKTRQSVKTGARYVTHPSIRAQWATEQEEKAQREREAAQKGAQKMADDVARNAQIQEDIQMKVFTGASTRRTNMNSHYYN